MRTSALAAVLAATAIVGCGKHHAPFVDDSIFGSGAPKDASTDGPLITIGPAPPPPADAGGLCGNQVIPLIIDRPNLYFVVDASGSMASPIDITRPGGPSRYDAAVQAILTLLEAVGHRVSYGAAIFPSPPTSNTDDGCDPGQEVFPTQPGDPVAFAISKKPGPILRGIISQISKYSPDGSTPTAASLETLKKNIFALSGKTYTFLLTDGAPNCNPAPCTAANCTINIEDGCAEPAGTNCCDPSAAGSFLSCLDGDPTVAAVADLAAGGVETFIIGMPGTTAYADLLNRMAIAGGSARGSDPEYYPVQGAADLAATLQQIGLAVAISCNVPLNQTPPDKSLVNVYFDSTVVPLDATNGWTWVSDSEIRLVGSSCTLLKGGNVAQVQVVAGCPTTTL